MRYTGPLGKQFSGDTAKAMSLQGAARLLVQQTIDRLKAPPFNGRGHLVQHRQLADGSWLHAMVNMIGAQPVIRTWIESPTTGRQKPIEVFGAVCWGGFAFSSGEPAQFITHEYRAERTCAIWMKPKEVDLDEHSVNAGFIDWAVSSGGRDLVLTWNHGLSNRYRLFPVASHNVFYKACGGATSDPVYIDTGSTIPVESALFIRGRRIKTQRVVIGAGATQNPPTIFYITPGSKDSACDSGRSCALYRLGDSTPLFVVSIPEGEFSAPWFFSDDGLKASTVVDGAGGSQTRVDITLTYGREWGASVSTSTLDSGNWTGVVGFSTTASGGGQGPGGLYSDYTVGPLKFVRAQSGVYGYGTFDTLIDDLRSKLEYAIGVLIGNNPALAGQVYIDEAAFSRLDIYESYADGFEGSFVFNGSDYYPQLSKTLLSFERDPALCPWYPNVIFGSSYTNKFIVQPYSYTYTLPDGSKYTPRATFDMRPHRDYSWVKPGSGPYTEYSDEYSRKRVVAIDYCENQECVVEQELVVVGMGYTSLDESSQKSWTFRVGDVDNSGTTYSWSQGWQINTREVEVGHRWELRVDGAVLVTAFGGITDSHEGNTAVKITTEEEIAGAYLGGTYPPGTVFNSVFSSERDLVGVAVSERVWLLAVDGRTKTVAYIKMRVSADLLPYEEGDELDTFFVDHESTQHRAWLVLVRGGEEVVNSEITAPTGFGFSDLYATSAQYQLLPRMFSGNEGFENDIPNQKLVTVGGVPTVVNRVWHTQTPQEDPWPNPHDAGLIASRLDSFWGYSINDTLLHPYFGWQTKNYTYKYGLSVTYEDADRNLAAQDFLDSLSLQAPSLTALKVF